MALSIRGPWWWFILHGEPFKDVENRDWNEGYARQQLSRIGRGEWLQIHAAKGMTVKEYEEGVAFARSAGALRWPQRQWFERYEGGLVGMARFEGAYRAYKSPWFTGPLGLVLAEPYPLPFQRCKGALGFFEPEI